MSAAAAPELRAALGGVEARVAAERIDAIWLFDPQRNGGRESGLAVLSLFTAGKADRRRVCVLRYQLEAAGDVRSEEWVEEGTVPSGRVERIIAGVVRRLDDALPPTRVDVAGDPERWHELLTASG
ncbi:hypothetical protein BH23GEM4_BH23GEM4_03870 [soil metagenome]